MEERGRCYWVDPSAAALGVKFQVALIHDVRPTRGELPELEELKDATVRAARAVDLETSSILAAYRHLFEQVGADSAVASPELLLRFAIDNGRLPKVNSVVDAYNAVSLQTLVVVSAHDLDRIEGNARILMTSGRELFYPLGSSEPVALPAGQWAGVVDNHVLCQMNCKQSELSKVTSRTKNLLIYVQGNPSISDEEMNAALADVCSAIVRFSGGRVEMLPRCDPDKDEMRRPTS
jgi:DNA/RNA-binding domain of Phe-tRNA-synthetase-like protein